MASSSLEVIEESVCLVDDLQINEKKLCAFAGGKIIVIRESENKFCAIGNTCSHYGAPLINGVLYKGHISCPWHGACFNIHTGDIEDFPGCDSIPSYETSVRDGSVFVKAAKKDIVKKRIKGVTSRNIVNRSTFIIIGGGPAGFQCAETLRQEGFDGRVVLISSETVPPYDRTKLSKSLTVKVEEILLRDENYYKKTGIELILNTTCTKLDTKSKIIYFNDGSNSYYDKLFIATGSSPRKYGNLSSDLVNVHYLRTHQDAKVIVENSLDKNVAIIGSSFIAMEIASYLNGKCKSISIFSKSEAPFANTLGLQVGQQIKQLFTSKNINFYVASQMELNVDGNKVTKVKLDSAEIEIDVCVVGIGSEPNTQFLAECDEVKLNKGFIEVNEQFQTSVENVYAGGDVVVYPNRLFKKTMNISHWQTAQAHGRKAALAMLGKESDFQSVPFFWSMVLGKGIRFAGTVEDPDNCIIEGNLEQLSFVAMYFNSNGDAVGVATMANDPVATAFAAALRNGTHITKSDIENNGFKWLEEIVQ